MPIVDDRWARSAVCAVVRAAGQGWQGVGQGACRQAKMLCGPWAMQPYCCCSSDAPKLPDGSGPSDILLRKALVWSLLLQE